MQIRTGGGRERQSWSKEKWTTKIRKRRKGKNQREKEEGDGKTEEQ